jgi:hypothetical protein
VIVQVQLIATLNTEIDRLGQLVPDHPRLRQPPRRAAR